MKSRYGFGLIVVSALLGCSTAAMAQAQSTGPNETAGEDTIIVEGQPIAADATPLAAEFVEYGTQVQIISDEEIKTGGFTNFGELAAGLIRGANVGYSPDEGEFTIRIDGGTDRDTLLLVDGVPYFDRSSPSEDLWPATAIDPRMISSIEIFRGGQSLYFGSNGGLGVVSVRSKEPNGELEGEVGIYGGSFKTREIYGNVSVPLADEGEHSILLFGRSYETDSNILFDREAFADTLLELGGFREYPYNYTNIGAKYLWQINDDTKLRAGYQLATVDFEDTFPDSTPYAPNRTEFSIFNASFISQVNDRLRIELEGHFQDNKLLNTEFDPQVCSIPRLADLPAAVRPLAPTGGFPNATAYENFARANGLPTGCVTNPIFSPGPSRANTQARSGIYINPANGLPYGTLSNPFPIGNPMGFVIQSVANFGTGVPTKGIGDVDQFVSGYIDYGANARANYKWTDWLETVVGIQNTSYKDNSDPVFGARDITLRSTGIYGDLRFKLPVLEGLNISLAGRHDFNTSFKDETVWKFGARQELPGGFYLRASGGTSYSAPKIDEIGAYGPIANVNPGLEAQSVEAYNFGAGINGQFTGGTFNIELGYFTTDITNLFGDREVQAVCLEYASEVRPGAINTRAAIERNRATIVPPDAFCATAAASNLAPNQTVAINTRANQTIEGFTVDLSLDTDLFQFDVTFTKNESLEPNPVRGLLARRDGTTADLSFVTPGRAGTAEFRQSAERPEWSVSGLFQYTPSDRWVISLNPRYQGPEWAYAPNNAARLVDAAGERVVKDINFGNYFVLNGSVQFYLGEERQHRFMVRAVNILGEDYFERYSGGSTLPISRAAVRGEINGSNSSFYRQYGWNGKPRSFWLQYEYNF
jgi:iron complex outermembrane recepter protein